MDNGSSARPKRRTEFCHAADREAAESVVADPFEQVHDIGRHATALTEAWLDEDHIHSSH